MKFISAAHTCMYICLFIDFITLFNTTINHEKHSNNNRCIIIIAYLENNILSIPGENFRQETLLF